ncbi:hypothetical protein RHSIM_Rhsim11G0128000 [Rhododendron simsii]|uniref:Uncharacterized protein n=1 Tax=Rhododendron simsii TaxID=118357 RepID=A0A834LBU7_RHOSS|nr:hypothetical protein RHSIM_Rhsim11G0128000 [Rhododendron simsii]
MSENGLESNQKKAVTEESNKRNMGMETYWQQLATKMNTEKEIHLQKLSKATWPTPLEPSMIESLAQGGFGGVLPYSVELGSSQMEVLAYNSHVASSVPGPCRVNEIDMLKKLTQHGAQAKNLVHVVMLMTEVISRLVDAYRSWDEERIPKVIEIPNWLVWPHPKV